MAGLSGYGNILARRCHIVDLKRDRTNTDEVARVVDRHADGYLFADCDRSRGYGQVADGKIGLTY